MARIDELNDLWKLEYQNLLHSKEFQTQDLRYKLVDWEITQDKFSEEYLRIHEESCNRIFEILQNISNF